MERELLWQNLCDALRSCEVEGDPAEIELMKRGDAWESPLIKGLARQRGRRAVDEVVESIMTLGTHQSKRRKEQPAQISAVRPGLLWTKFTGTNAIQQRSEKLHYKAAVYVVCKVDGTQQ